MGRLVFVLDIFEVIVALNSQIRTNFITKQNKIVGLNDSPVTLAKNLEVSATKTILVVCVSPKSPPSHTKSPRKSEHGK